MSYAIKDQEKAEREAARLNNLKDGYQYKAAPYERSFDQYGQQTGVISWGIVKYQIDYFTDGSRRCLGFVWNWHEV